MDRREINDIRHRVQALAAAEREISFYCECADANCRAVVALPASVFVDLRREGVPILFSAHAPEEDAPLAAEQGFESGVIPPAQAPPPLA